MDKIESTVRKTIADNDLLSKGDSVILGLSGGPDSVCLFYLLCKMRDELDLNIRVIHVNHCIRPGDADDDQRYVEGLCDERGVPCRVVKFDCPAEALRLDMTEEEVGRDARYSAFSDEAEMLKRQGIDPGKIKIAVAHNSDDQVETILFRMLVRGTGTDGISGMEYRRLDRKGHIVVRPLLDCRKSDIVSFCKEKDLNPRLDYTNESTDYSRNKIRLEMIPFLEKFNPRVKEAVLRLGNTAREDRRYLEKTGQELLEKALAPKEFQRDDAVLLKGDVMRAADKPIRLRAIKAAFKRVGFEEDFTYNHMEAVDALLFNSEPSPRVDLPQGFYAAGVYGDLRIAFSEEEIQSGVRTAILERDRYDALCKTLNKGDYAGFDADVLEGWFGGDPGRMMEWRTRKTGDFMELSGGKHKKVKEIFIDDKVPRDLRDKVMIAAIGNQVLFIPAVVPGGKGRYSAFGKITDATKRVFFVERFSAI